MQDVDGAPRAKRRFERVSTRLERFHISPEAFAPHAAPQFSLESSSSEDEMAIVEEEPATCEYGEQEGIHVAGALVEEPEEDHIEESGNLNKNKDFLLDERLAHFLKSENRTNPLNEVLQRLTAKSEVGPGALTVWRPIAKSVNPFDDPTMKGRIYEVEDGEEQDPEQMMEDENWVQPSYDPCVSYPEEGFQRNKAAFNYQERWRTPSGNWIDAEDLGSGSSSRTGSGSALSSYCSSSEFVEGMTGRIVELTDGTMSTEGEEMEMD